MTLDELRRLKPRDIGSWPALPKLGALLLLLILILVGGLLARLGQPMGRAQRRARQGRAAAQPVPGQEAPGDQPRAYRKQLADIEQSFGALLKQLPNRSEMEALLSDINQAGLGRGLQFELFKPAAPRSCPISMPSCRSRSR